MNFDFHDEMWQFVLGGVLIAALAAGMVFLLTGHNTAGLNLPG